MAENQAIEPAELERMTNEAEGWVAQTPEGEPTPEATPAQTEPSPEPAAAPATPEPSKAVPIPEEVLKVLEETPYKTIPDIVKGYKNSQSEFTKLSERVKPYEQLLNDVSTDPNLRQFIDQAVQLYRNPQLAQTYQQPSTEPNPMNYDFSTVEGIQQFQKDTVAHAQKAAFETVNQRMSGWEQQQALEKAKFEFKSKYPEQDPNDVLKFVQERNGKWSLEDAFKIRNYDKLKEQAYEQAKKEILGKANEAAKNAPVSSAPADKPSVSPSEIMAYVSRYGFASANTKWGKDKVEVALKQFTEENS